MLLGLTRDNVSHSALAIGVAIGCGCGGVLVPFVLPFIEQQQQQDGGDSNQLNSSGNSTTAAKAAAVAAGVASTVASNVHVSTRGYLSLYLSALRAFPHQSLYANWCVVLVSFLLLLFVHRVYQWMWRPFEYRRGYEPERRLAAAYLRSAGNIPPGYPNTWFKVCDVLDVPASYAKGCFRIDALGEALCILRLPAVHPFGPTLREGEVVVLVESSLGGVDPSRDLMGACDPRRNPRAQRWHSQEINQMVFIWHHDDNHTSQADLDARAEKTGGGSANPDDSSACAATPQKPLWEIPLIPGIENWSYHGRVTHEIACHIQEIPENGADVAHLDYIHGGFLLSWMHFIRHEWQAVWSTQAEPVGHVAKLVLNQQVSVFGYKIPFTSLDSRIDQVGPALVQLIFPTPFGRVAVVETVTPILHTLQRAQNVLWAERTVPRFMAKIFLMGLVVQFERDIPIWNAKHFLRRPLILKEDGPILKYRRWMRQFYSNREYQQEMERHADSAMRFANE